MPGLPQETVVAVIGSGAMGAGIAQVAAAAGHVVLMFDAREGAAAAGRAGIVATLDRLVARGKMDGATRDGVADRLRVAETITGLAPAGLVIEAIVERLDTKRSLFAQLEDIVAPDAILATNTSSLSVTAVAAGLRRPERVAGMHFFNPAPLMQLVEVVSGLASDPAVLQQVQDTAQAWGKTPVRASSTPGFIVNRVARPFYAEALRLFEEGVATPATLDAIMRESGGFRMGPFELMDLIGHDVNFAVTRSVFDAFFGDPRYRPSLAQQELVAAGWLGRKTGRGFFDYTPDLARPEPQTAPAAPAPAQVVVEGDLGQAEPLVGLLAAQGITVEHRAGQGYIRLPGATLAPSDGRSVCSRIAAGAPSDLVLFDLALDYAAASRIAIAADSPDHPALGPAAAMFQALGKAVSVIADSPGLIVLRTVAMLVNEAFEARFTGVASGQDIDRAMRLGANHPIGPMAWAGALGIDRVAGVLHALHSATGDTRYRLSQALQQAAEQRH